MGLKKKRNAGVKYLTVYVRSLYNPLDDLKEINTFKYKNNGNIYGTKPKFIGGFCHFVAGINKLMVILINNID